MRNINNAKKNIYLYVPHGMINVLVINLNCKRDLLMNLVIIAFNAKMKKINYCMKKKMKHI